MRDRPVTLRATKPLVTMAISVGAIAASAWADLPKTLIWNGSASAPIGLYWVSQRDLEKGDLVLAHADSAMQFLLNERGYLPPGTPILKRIAAVQGDEICRENAAISINGRVVATALIHDSKGRYLPVWSGCHVLMRGEIFLLNDHPRSLDGRYFGVTDDALVMGRAHLLWARP